MLWLLNWLFGVVGNYGIAIVLLTLIVKTLLFPITDMSYRSMAKMKEIQPELTKLRAKYESDRQMQAQKQMELFKKKGVNPAGGCLPMLLQIPGLVLPSIPLCESPLNFMVLLSFLAGSMI